MSMQCRSSESPQLERTHTAISKFTKFGDKIL